ncbi:hypothetical protein CR513_48986, partial [Mucuna pruriens]
MVDLILSVLASKGEPSPSTMEIVVEDGVIESRPCFTVSIITDLNFLHKLLQCMTRSSTDRLYELDPEIELTLLRLRKVRKRVVNNSSSSSSVINSNQYPTDNSISSFSHFVEPGQMENNDRTLKELATPDMVYQPWCIQYPQLEPAQTYEL